MEASLAPPDRAAGADPVVFQRDVPPGVTPGAAEPTLSSL